MLADVKVQFLLLICAQQFCVSAYLLFSHPARRHMTKHKPHNSSSRQQVKISSASTEVKATHEVVSEGASHFVKVDFKGQGVKMRNGAGPKSEQSSCLSRLKVPARRELTRVKEI